MSRLFIIEDERPAARRLQQLIGECLPTARIEGVADSVEGSLNWFRENPPPDLVFMDIQLADGTSFEIFEGVAVESPVIFTTAYDEYTLKAFKVNSIDYLLKPVKKEELKEALEKWESLRAGYQAGQIPVNELLQYLKSGRKEYKKRFLVYVGDRIDVVEEQEIAYFFTEQKAVLLCTNGGKKYSVDHTLEELEQLLDPALFFRLNRQVISHLKAIKSIHQYFKGKLLVHLKPQELKEVVVSREKSPLFKQWLSG